VGNRPPLLGSQVYDYWSDPWGRVHERWADTDRLNAANGGNLLSAEEGFQSQWGERPAGAVHRATPVRDGAASRLAAGGVRGASRATACLRPGRDTAAVGQGTPRCRAVRRDRRGQLSRHRRRIAALGYDVALFDSNTIVAARKGRPLREALREAIAQARQLPHALPGKIGMVGFSLGGGMALGYGSSWSNDVAVVSAWYPSTRDIKDVSAFVGRITVPVVMFAGTADEYRFCCMIDKAREIAQAAKAANAPFELTTYSGVRHGFTIPGTDYDPGSTDDALAKTAAALKRHISN
jgi:dienelactone hydrolase